MKALLIGLALMTACAVEPATSATKASLCTVEDQQAGTCQGPAGGWTALQQRTRDYAASVDPATMGSPLYCSSNSDGTRYCTLSVSTPGHWLVINCGETSPGGSVNCTWFYG